MFESQSAASPLQIYIRAAQEDEAQIQSERCLISGGSEVKRKSARFFDLHAPEIFV